jgi:hypothetical protein
MKTPPMFYPQEDGKLVEIPEEHAAILELYRDRMPVVWEIQETGPHYLYALIDVDEEPYGTPQPGALENASRRVAGYLKAKRLGEDPAVPDFERLAVAAIRAYVEEMGVFAGSLSHGDGPKAVEQSIKTETARAGRKLKTAVDSAVRDHATNLVENWWVKA